MRSARSTLITTILDPADASGEDLAGLYARRWEIESSFDELKTHQRGPNVVLRSKSPDGVLQEIYGCLCARYAIRSLIGTVTAEFDEDPRRGRGSILRDHDVPGQRYAHRLCRDVGDGPRRFVPNVAMLMVMIASEADKTALSKSAQARRDALNTLLERNGSPATVTEVADFSSILRRRLFETEPPAEVLAATASLFRPALTDKAWEKNVWSSMNSRWRDDWDRQVAACYPFHPFLMALAKEEWSQVTGFQQVRSTIRIFAATVYAQQ